MFVKPVILPIYWHTDETAKLENCDIDFDIKECDIRYVYFYHIVAVVDRLENGKICGCTVVVPGDKFICKLQKEEVIKKIEKAFS